MIAPNRKRLAAAVLVLLLWTSLTIYTILGPDPSRRVLYSHTPWADSATTFSLSSRSDRVPAPSEIWCP